MYLCQLVRECPVLDCEIIFEPSEWKFVYARYVNSFYRVAVLNPYRRRAAYQDFRSPMPATFNPVRLR